jgi:hypothetical protein
VAPKDKTQIELSRFIRDSVVDFWFFLSIHDLHFRACWCVKSLSAFTKIVHQSRKTANGKGRTHNVRPPGTASPSVNC